VRQVRHAEHQVREALLDVVELRRRRLHGVANSAHLRHHRSSVFTAALHCTDLLRQRVAAHLQFFGARLDLATFGFQCRKRSDVEGVAALGQALGDSVRVFAQKLNVEHDRAGS